MGYHIVEEDMQKLCRDRLPPDDEEFLKFLEEQECNYYAPYGIEAGVRATLSSSLSLLYKSVHTCILYCIVHGGVIGIEFYMYITSYPGTARNFLTSSLLLLQYLRVSQGKGHRISTQKTCHNQQMVWNFAALCNYQPVALFEKKSQ